MKPCGWVHVTDMWHARHGFWVPKLGVVESRICGGGGGFGRGGARFSSAGYSLNCDFARLDVKGKCSKVCNLHGTVRALLVEYTAVPQDCRNPDRT